MADSPFLTMLADNIIKWNNIVADIENENKQLKSGEDAVFYTLREHWRDGKFEPEKCDKLLDELAKFKSKHPKGKFLEDLQEFRALCKQYYTKDRGVFEAFCKEMNLKQPKPSAPQPSQPPAPQQPAPAPPTPPKPSTPPPPKPTEPPKPTTPPKSTEPKTVLFQLLTAVSYMVYAIAGYYLREGFWQIIGAWIVGGSVLFLLWGLKKKGSWLAETGGFLALMTLGLPVTWNLLSGFIPVLFAWVGCILIACMMFSIKAVPQKIRIAVACIFIALSGAYIWINGVPELIHGIFASSLEQTEQTAKQTETKPAEPQRIDYPDGRYYIGETKDGKRHGQGEIFWKNGSRLKGKWTNDAINGQAEGYNSTQKRTDKGEYRDSQRTGRGVMIWDDGRRYEGEWNQTGRAGRGIMTWTDGNRYEGEWSEDKQTGNGTYYNATHKRTDTGQFVNGMRIGKFTIKWDDGARYEGLCNDDDDGNSNGEGIYYYASGKTEKGKWISGKWVKSTE